MQAELYWVAKFDAGRIAVMPRPRSGDWLDEELQSLRRSGVEVLVSLLTPEEVEELQLDDEARLCAENNIQLLSHPVEDRQTPPDDDESREFIRSLAELVDQGKSIAVQCRMGLGRSALVVADVLVLKGESVDEALRTISSARGQEVPDTEEQVDWLRRFERSVHPKDVHLGLA
jgi:protein-tyrosine phosphatase